ncbi:hypothetical protein MLD38_005274 [Melastoma candidum]|uniref:Uncharacterized protein n=1 Tax=Melastoma candidum TaxID=119954 RepID=A0ACB9S953_9MYRT|nr:hypothetical protein MLD38_005274 [Melastoma candidum]
MAEHTPNPSTQTTPGSGVSRHSALIDAPQMQIPASVFASLVKLEEGNYLVWKGQVLAAIIAAGFEDYVFGRISSPPEFLDTECLILNPEFKVWQRTDKAVMSLLFSALSTEPLHLVVCCKTSCEVWDVLRNRYESVAPSRVMNLRMQMQQLKKEGKTMQQFLNTLKNLSEQLTAVGEPVTQRDYLWYMLEGLPSEYDAVVTSIYSRSDQPTVEEVQNLLLNVDLRMERRQVSDCTLPQVHHSALNSGSMRSQHGSQTPSYPKQPTQTPYKPPFSQSSSYVHYTNPSSQTFSDIHSAYPSHTSSLYTSSPDHTLLPTIPPPSSYQPAPFAGEWLIDSGATHHVTTNIANLHNVATYQGPSTVKLGNGSHADILHTGDRSLGSESGVLNLFNILHTPAISQNLISVSKLCRDNNVFVEFHPDVCFVKDKSTNQILLQGTMHQGLYTLVRAPSSLARALRFRRHEDPGPLPGAQSGRRRDSSVGRCGRASG